MTSIDSVENQKICVELARGDISNLQSSVYKIVADNARGPPWKTNNAS